MKINRDKCIGCKYLKKEFDDGWSYRTIWWCKKGIITQDKIDECNLDEEEVTFSETVAEWANETIPFIIISIAIIGIIVLLSS